MSLALYRKYRPQNFDELVGQDHIVQILKSAIQKGQIAHAYLFVGGRGVGKTSTARIFAKELGVSNKDLYELDAASNRKIDDFRELADSVHSLPFESKYKIYIIDEVHMLTKEAFNAFLKTLEEPPEHVIFILATTDFDKVPDTIKSRCQILQFKLASKKSIKEALLNVAQKENVQIGEDALNLLAFAAAGSFRDALGLFQKALAVSDSKVIKLQDVENSSHSAPLSSALDMLDALSDKGFERAFEISQKLKETGANFKQFMELLAELLRTVILTRLSKQEEKRLQDEYTDESFKILLKASQSKHLNSKTLLTLLEKNEYLAFASDQSLILDIFISELKEAEDKG